MKGVLWAGVERGFYFAGKGDSEGLRIVAVFAPFLDVYYADIINPITLCPLPPPPLNSPQRYDFKELTPNDYMDKDLSPVFGLNSRFGAVLGGIWRFFAH